MYVGLRAVSTCLFQRRFQDFQAQVALHHSMCLSMSLLYLSFSLYLSIYPSRLIYYIFIFIILLSKSRVSALQRQGAQLEVLVQERELAGSKLSDLILWR